MDQNGPFWPKEVCLWTANRTLATPELMVVSRRRFEFCGGITRVPLPGPKIEYTLFLLKHFEHPWDIPAKVPGYTLPKSLLSLGHIELFGPGKPPTPEEDIWTQKFELCSLFLPDLSLILPQFCPLFASISLILTLI